MNEAKMKLIESKILEDKELVSSIKNAAETVAYGPMTSADAMALMRGWAIKTSKNGEVNAI